MKSFKHEHLFYLHSIHVQSTYIVTSTAQTDLGLRHRIFSQEIISLLHFLKSLKRGNVKRLCYTIR